MKKSERRKKEKLDTGDRGSVILQSAGIILPT
jgi:hypothetical protein